MMKMQSAVCSQDEKCWQSMRQGEACHSPQVLQQLQLNAAVSPPNGNQGQIERHHSQCTKHTLATAVSYSGSPTLATSSVGRNKLHSHAFRCIPTTHVQPPGWCAPSVKAVATGSNLVPTAPHTMNRALLHQWRSSTWTAVVTTTKIVQYTL